MPPAELHRPTPEQFLNLIRRQTRGRLKVYLGSAAGVGKTFAMLDEGWRRHRRGGIYGLPARLAPCNHGRGAKIS